MPRDALEQLTDEALLVAYVNGARDAARVLLQRLGPFCFAVAYRQLGRRSDSEDVAQEALLRLWQNASRFRPEKAKVTTWLYRIICNLCVDMHRKQRDNAQIELAEQRADDSPSVAEDLQAKARRAALRTALMHLPERQRIAVSLRHLEELSNAEIAQIMETSIDAVESMIARGRRALTAQLGSQKQALGLIEEERYVG